MTTQANISERECWAAVPGWPYEAGDMGHIRPRSRIGTNSNLLRFRTGPDGAQYVTLTKHGKNIEFDVDLVICDAFHGGPPHDDSFVRHLDGVIWNNNRSNLRWDSDMTKVVWGVFTPRPPNVKPTPVVWHDGILAAVNGMSKGDILLGWEHGKGLIAFEIKLDSQRTIRPFSQVAFYRATAMHIASTELGREGITMSKGRFQNPADAVKQYRELASAHSNIAWSFYLAEAANIIEELDYIIRANTHKAMGGPPAERPAIAAPARAAPARAAPRPFFATTADQTPPVTTRPTFSARPTFTRKPTNTRPVFTRA